QLAYEWGQLQCADWWSRWFGTGMSGAGEHEVVAVGADAAPSAGAHCVDRAALPGMDRPAQPPVSQVVSVSNSNITYQHQIAAPNRNSRVNDSERSDKMFVCHRLINCHFEARCP